MEAAIYFGLFIPLIGFLILMLSSKTISRKAAGLIGCGAIFFSFITFASLLTAYNIYEPGTLHTKLFSWININGISADFALTLDSLTLLMTMIITGVGFLIHVYSNGYMDHEEDYARFFAYMNFFVFSMLLLVLASNLLLLFVGWEGVGLASYLLIGFWYQRKKASHAAVKAFVVNRVGDLGLLLGIIFTFVLFGTTDIEAISAKASGIDTMTLTVLTALFFIGSIGKSAQIPLHIWLPDAMEGPTPVSALIHAATMVTAGVYLVVRLHTVFSLAPETLYWIGVIGVTTSLFAAIVAVVQTDLKRVLAYSTVSQLGLMFLACGTGAFYSAMFHLTTHAFVKALLFLSAGNVVHMMHGNTEMKTMGGLKKVFPVTHWLFLIGVLAMSGFPPFATFFSKDLILEQEYLSGYETLFYVGVAASVLTAFYLTRAYVLTFLGASHSDLEGVHEAPFVMTGPVLALGFLSLVGGLLGFTFRNVPLLEGFLYEVGITPIEKHLNSGFILNGETLIAIGGTILGIGVAAFLYLRYKEKLRAPFIMIQKGFYFDTVYEKGIVRPLKGIAYQIDERVEPKFFTGSLRFLSGAVSMGAKGLQHIQSGQIRSYVSWMALGSVFLIVYFIF
jgi:NADH-quinone oxidoreductase subunit L